MKDAILALRKGLKATLVKLDAPVGDKLQQFPRVEIVDVSESTPIDKEDSVRECAFTLEVIGNRDYDQIAEISNPIQEALCGSDTISMNGFKAVQVYKELSTEIMEVGDADSLVLRLRTQYRAILEEKINK